MPVFAMQLVVVSHDPKLLSQYKQFIDELAEKGVRRIAMELPSNWEKGTMFEPFFHPLARYARAKGMKVYGIDPEAGYKRARLLQTAIEIKQKFSEEMLKVIKKRFETYVKNNAIPPDYTPFQFETERKALDLALSHSLQQLLRNRVVVNRYRNKKMIENIKRADYEVVMVAVNHAVAISEAFNVKPYDYRDIVKRKLGEREPELREFYRKLDKLFEERRKQKGERRLKRRKRKSA
jgi:hypothetical protein